MKIAQVRRLALSLPEATEEPHFQSASFRIRGKIFATVPPGDEFLHVFVSDEQRELALATEPGFIEKLFWGKRVWGVRVVLAKATPKVVKQLLMQAWTCKAPKSLVPSSDAAATCKTSAQPAKGTSVKQNKTTQTDASVDAYLAAIKDPSRQSDCASMIGMMKVATRQEPKMWGSSIVGFGTRHYRYESGREGDICVLGFASRKDAIVLYLCGGLDPHAERLQKLGKHKTGKGCLYIRKLDDVDTTVLRAILKTAAAHAA